MASECEWTYEIREETKMKDRKVTGRKLVFTIYQITDLGDGTVCSYDLVTVFETTILERGFEEEFQALLEEGREGKLDISGYTFKFKPDKIKFEGPDGKIVLEKSDYSKTKEELMKIAKAVNTFL
jgi:hypothetical protein